MIRCAPILLLLTGCKGLGGDFEPYYADREDPTVSGLSATSEPGNIGGRTITITGSGFGDSVDDVVVLLGNHNSSVLSVSDSEIVIETPRGPITGGPVDLVIATEKGYVNAEDAYTYDVTTADGTDLYTGQTAFIATENLWTSCYGGMWDNADYPGAGCDQIAYIGSTGLDGVSEWYSFAYPRLHTTETGWLTGTDSPRDGWHVTSSFDVPYPSGIDDLRRSVGSFELRNPKFSGEDECIDPTVDPGEGNDVACNDSDAIRYDRGVLRFCEGEDYETGPDSRYRADWPLKYNFFQSDPEDDDSHFTPTDIEIHVPGAGVAATVTVPGAIHPQAIQGYASPTQWALSAPSACMDGNGDGESLLDDDGIVFAWEPIGDDVELMGPGVTAVGSYVHVSVSSLPIGWFGLMLGAPRASIVVPDDNAYDPDSGLASVAIPNSVLYQIPTPNPEWTGYNQFGGGKLGSYDSAASYVLLEIYRVTDYRIDTAEGPLVYSYVTGDLSFMSWDNPMSRSSECDDCLDGDGDGWTDALDPDCDDDIGNGTVEDNATYGMYTCNDGRDNNDDGLIDADDPLCADGFSGETTCGDGLDNDEDGWVDALDAECVGDPDANELGDDDPSATCSDGIDNDSDGWIDVGDPACATGADAEDDGFLGGACNDGVDNDGHGDIDALDPYCYETGALADTEVPTMLSQCVDGTDNDSDNYLDDYDPDCEYTPRSREYGDYFEAGSWDLIPGCYDGIDNDGDGSADGEDPSCWRGDLDFRGDGFLNDEGADWGTGCTDGADSDADGWIDGEDPDCVVGDAAAQDEIGYGTTACNDGVDNNEDGKIDRESSYCKDAGDNYEGP